MKSQNNIAIFSFFSGAGFLDLGFEKEGHFDILFVNEIQKSFIETYKKTRSTLKLDEPYYGFHNHDINKFLNGNNNNIKALVNLSKRKYNFTGFIGGPPCPDFSVGGKNRGKDGENGRLTESYINIISDLKPDFFLFENVKGLYRTKRHREFYNEMKRKLETSGYLMTERLTNALEFGVPQNRDRILLIGFRKNLMTDLKIKTSFALDLKFPWDSNKKFAKNHLKNACWPTVNKFGENSILPRPDKVIQELTVEHWFKKNDVNNHANSQHYFQPRAGLKKFLAVDEGDDSKKSYKRLHRWRYSPTVAYGNNEVHLHPYFPRRISVAEALSLQSLPKNFVLPEDVTLTDMFKMIGNGVPYLLAKNIAKTIFTFLNTEV